MSESGPSPKRDATRRDQPGYGGQARQGGRPGGAGPDGGGPGGGVSWTYDVDLSEVLAAIAATGPGGGRSTAGDAPGHASRPGDASGSGDASSPDDASGLDDAPSPGQGPGSGGLPGLGAWAGGVDPWDDEAFAQECALVDASGSAPRDLTGPVAERLPAGPGLAAWLSQADPDTVPGYDLPGVASAFRRVAAWAQAGELAAVAAMTARAAARDPQAGARGADGEPPRVTAAAASEVALELVMTQAGASWWAALAVDLRWRLPGTGEALAAGLIDVPRARLICEATARLADDTARAVEALVLPRAGALTTAQLRVALRRAVITADPEGAEDRRRDAETRAKVSLYPDHDGTATVSATNLPGVTAAAMLARLSALARAMKAAGSGGGLDLLRAQALAGLVLGTLGMIPPPAGDPGPPDPPDDDPGDPGRRPGSHPGPVVGGDGPEPGGRRPRGSGRGQGQGDDGSGPGGRPGNRSPGDGGPGSGGYGPGESGHGAGEDDRPGPGGRGSGGRGPVNGGGSDPDEPADHGAGPRGGPCSGGSDDHGPGCSRPDGVSPEKCPRDAARGSGAAAGRPPPGSPRGDSSAPPADSDSSAPPGNSCGAPGDSSAPPADSSAPPGSSCGAPGWPRTRDDPPGDPPGSPFSDWPPPGSLPGPRPPENLPRLREEDEGCPGDWLPDWPPLPAAITDIPPLLGTPPPVPWASPGPPPRPARNGAPGSADDLPPARDRAQGSADDPAPGPADDPRAVSASDPLPGPAGDPAAGSGRPPPPRSGPGGAGPGGAGPGGSGWATVPAVGPNTARTDAGTVTQRPAGLLDLTISWAALACQSESPAHLGRLGPVTAAQARLLALTAVPDPHAQWRVILTSPAGQALAVERVRRGSKSCPPQPGRPPGLLGRVTVTVPATVLDQPWPPDSSREGLILTAILRAATRAAAMAAAARAADEQAPGGCAHTAATPAYRPPRRLREYIEARDQTCRHPRCRQPAWRADLDHTRPWHKGGPTCSCNIGGFCRVHHQVKQGPGWVVTQPRSGHFQITTPAGRSYDVHPDTYPA